MRKLRDVIGQKGIPTLVLKHLGRRRSLSWFALAFAQGGPLGYMAYLFIAHSDGNIARLPTIIKANQETLLYVFIGTSFIVTILGAIADSLMAVLEDVMDNQNRIMGVVAHDLRGPLGSLNHIAEILHKNDETSAQDYQQLTEQLQKTTRHLLLLTNDLLDISALKAGPMVAYKKELDLIEIIQHVLHVYGPLFNAKKVELSGDPSIFSQWKVWALVDPNRFEQAIVNLLSNALKFSLPQQSVEIKLELFEREHFVIVNVIDHGPGMNKEQLAKLFIPFIKGVRGTANEKSTGLGLYIVKRVIELHQGEVHIQSSPKGTIVELKIPVIKIEPRASSIFTSKPKILVVDDSEEFLTIVAHWLKEIPVELVTIQNPLDAKVLDPNGLDLILIDYNMPEMKGTELMKYWKKHFPNASAKIIGLSAMNDSETQQDFLRAGAQMVEIKPLNKQRLLDLLPRPQQFATNDWSPKKLPNKAS